MSHETLPVVFGQSQPILAVADLLAAVRYYCDRLGFAREWFWGDPPNFGGATRDRVHVCFCLQPELAGRVAGHQHAFMVSGIDRLYAEHRRRGADIIAALEAKPWGLREYVVRDPSGYHLRFGEGIATHATGATPKPLPASIRLVERLPTLEEYGALIQAVGWGSLTNRNAVTAALQNTRYAVVAVDGDQVVGMARVVGDGAMACYVQDVMVLPACQRQGIGTALVEAVMRYFHERTPPQATIGLFTGRNLAGFYERHGFEGPETGLYGMYFRKSPASSGA